MDLIIVLLKVTFAQLGSCWESFFCDRLWPMFPELYSGAISGKWVVKMIKRIVKAHKPIAAFMLMWALSVGQGLTGQSVVVEVEENIRSSENGTVLGRMNKGGEFQLIASGEGWMQINLQGWVWEASLQSIDRGGFDLMVSSTIGENIRDEPQGTIIGRLEDGTLLKSVEKITGWIRVERKVWIWAQSVDVQGIDVSSKEETLGIGQDETEWLTVGNNGLPVLNIPNGDTLLRALPRSSLEVLARQGNWAQVTINGWVWAPETSQDLLELPLVVDVQIADIADRGKELQGRLLQWDLQFISVEEADGIRSDFYQNETFLLTKLANSEDDFVYVTFSEGLEEELTLLTPLDYVRVVGRLRTASEKLTEAPILELISLERVTYRNQ